MSYKLFTMKRAYNIDEQISLLKEYGVIFDNEEKAKEILLDVGFYRMGFYSFPYEKTFPSLINRTHVVKEGTTFKSIYDLYDFDTNLRRILLNALDRIEVNIRTQITYIVSNHYVKSPTWFADSNIMATSFVNTFEEKVYKTLRDNPVIQRHHNKYINDKYAPAWKTIEFMTLGNLTSLYKAIKDDEVKRIIAKRYGCSIKVFLNYLETIRVIRNKCAHGNCIYNIQTAKGISIKPAGVTDDSRHNINGAICVIKYILGTISPERRKDLEKDIAGLMNAKRDINATEIIKNCTKIAI